MSAGHWLVVRGVTPSSFWAEVFGVIDRPGMALKRRHYALSDMRWLNLPSTAEPDG